ncbi:hypothetical protein BRADI_3g35155v3 [Brachypodium distachyon]|uniref:Uncharacterized protein n=1 Tax=Brachypodium distachyon TaxID=15368 RepID=A0A0Q3ICR3_BRADI|nr:hypothetical protein BRADI_3g35155v3 [Brachypodium distachyon]
MGTRLVAAGDVATGESEPGTLLEAVLGCTSARGCQWRSAVKSRSTARSMQSWEGFLEGLKIGWMHVHLYQKKNVHMLHDQVLGFTMYIPFFFSRSLTCSMYYYFGSFLHAAVVLQGYVCMLGLFSQVIFVVLLFNTWISLYVRWIC